MELKETKKDKTEKTIYRNRKANYLSIHRGLKRKKDHSWKEKAKALEYSLKKSTKFLINRDRSIKGL